MSKDTCESSFGDKHNKPSTAAADALAAVGGAAKLPATAAAAYTDSSSETDDEQTIAQIHQIGMAAFEHARRIRTNAVTTEDCGCMCVFLPAAASPSTALKFADNDLRKVVVEQLHREIDEYTKSIVRLEAGMSEVKAIASSEMIRGAAAYLDVPVQTDQ